jgi:CBS domain containing-hemolysin-like protein
MRCALFDDDPLRDLMTETRHVVTVPASISGAAALVICRERRVQRLLVTEGDEIVGVALREELEGADRAGDRARAPVLSAPASAPIGAAVIALRDDPLGIVLALHGDELAGVITRGDLVAAGVPVELMARPMLPSGA